MMSVKRKLKRELTSFITDTLGYNVIPGGPVFGRRIEKQKRLGYDRQRDWKKFLTRDGAHVLFDVGANVGQTAWTFVELFPVSRVFSFEPDPRVFKELENSTNDSRIVAVNAALGAYDGQANLYVNGLHVTNSLLDNAPDASRYVEAAWLAHREIVPVNLITIDTFCREKNISRIDMLKIDAQGYELQVIEGARGMIDAKRIPLIYLEVNFVAIYQDQPLFHHVYQHLLDRNYRLVGLYGACSNQNYLVSSDALFVRD